jgi:O-antigen ligase
VKDHSTRHFYLCAAIAFMLPIWPQALPSLIVLLVLNRLLHAKFSTGSWPSPGIFFVFVSLYLLYLAGLLWSANMNYGLKDLETKLSLLLFPLVFFFSPAFGKERFHKILAWFVYGCVFSFLLCSGWGIYQYVDEKMDMSHGVHRDNFGYYYFFSSRYSPFLHPSYLAMYVVLALMIIHFLHRSGDKTVSLANGRICSAIFIVFILLLNSKAGILSLILFGVYFTWYNIFVAKKVKLTLLIIVSFASIITGLYFGVSEFSSKVNKAIDALFGRGVDASADESSAKRVLVWSASAEVIKNNWITGTGTGDAKDELLSVYKERGMMVEYNANLNSHNQFLQTFIALGIAGIISFLALLFVPAFLALRSHDLLYFFFIILFVVNTVVESMLETQAGVIFFAFFNCLLMRQMPFGKPRHS